MNFKKLKRLLSNPNNLVVSDDKSQVLPEISAEVRRIVTYLSVGNVQKALIAIATWVGRAIDLAGNVTKLDGQLKREAKERSLWNNQAVLLRHLLEATIAGDLPTWAPIILTEGLEVLMPDTLAHVLFEVKRQRGSWTIEEEELFERSLAKAREGGLLTDDSLFRVY